MVIFPFVESIFSILLLASASVTNMLPEITVMASPVTQTETVTSDGVETAQVGRRQLDALNAQDLQSALKQVPGVSISRYGAVGSYGGAQGGSVYVRGVGTARPGGEVRVYSDGAPRESGVWGHPLMDSLPVDFAQNVTIQKNPHPSERAGSFAAVETESLRRRKEGYEGEANLAYGKDGTFLSSVRAGAKKDEVDAYAGYSHKQSQGHRKHSQANLDGVFGRVGVSLSETEYVSFIYQRSDSKVENPGEEYMPTPKYDCFGLASDFFQHPFRDRAGKAQGFYGCIL